VSKPKALLVSVSSSRRTRSVPSRGSLRVARTDGIRL
jgi:hypothetical protein